MSASQSSSHRIDILTLFPAILDSYLGQSILSRAIALGLVGIERFNIRDWAEGKHKQVDDRPFGGGPGMVLMAPPVVAATEAVRGAAEPSGRLILLSPQGADSIKRWLPSWPWNHDSFFCAGDTRGSTSESAKSSSPSWCQ